MPNGAVNHVFTINNPFNTNKLYKPICEWVESGICVYVRWALEKGDEGTIHYQGYMLGHTGVKKTNKWLGKELGTCIDFNSMNGSIKQNDDYVEKVGAYANKAHTHLLGPWEYGQRPRVQQGKRTDLMRVCEMIKDGATEEEVAEEHGPTVVKYHSGLGHYRELVTPVPVERPRVIVLYGHSNTGKSHYAKTLSASYFQVPIPRSNERWHDGYRNQDVILWDEFMGQWSIHFMKCWLRDRVQLEVKNGFKKNRSKYIVLTSNTNPRNWYDNGPTHIAALFNRFDDVFEVTSEGWKIDPNDEYFVSTWRRDDKNPLSTEFRNFMEK